MHSRSLRGLLFFFAGSTLLMSVPGPALAENGSCAHGSGNISGGPQTVRIAGICSKLMISGEHNQVFATLAPDAVVKVSGGANSLLWTPADPKGTKPSVVMSGTGNSVTRQRR